MGRIAWRRIGLAILAIVSVACALPVADPATAGPAGASGVPRAPAGMPVVSLGDLPPEAADTVALILDGGPFPYRQDGAVFENREGLLPEQPSGFYREYTVPTPGEDDRGARRIVAGADGSLYWTADHYDSFAWIDR